MRPLPSSTATTDGSLRTIPSPATLTSVLAVPRSMARSRPSQWNHCQSIRAHRGLKMLFGSNDASCFACRRIARGRYSRCRCRRRLPGAGGAASAGALGSAPSVSVGRWRSVRWLRGGGAAAGAVRRPAACSAGGVAGRSRPARRGCTACAAWPGGGAVSGRLGRNLGSGSLEIPVVLGHFGRQAEAADHQRNERHDQHHGVDVAPAAFRRTRRAARRGSLAPRGGERPAV